MESHYCLLVTARSKEQSCSMTDPSPASNGPDANHGPPVDGRGPRKDSSGNRTSMEPDFQLMDSSVGRQ